MFWWDATDGTASPVRRKVDGNVCAARRQTTSCKEAAGVPGFLDLCFVCKCRSLGMYSSRNMSPLVLQTWAVNKVVADTRFRTARPS